VETLSGIGSLGFTFTVRESGEDKEHNLAGDGPLAILKWSDLTIGATNAFEGESMVVAEAMLALVGEDACAECTRLALENLDFGSLSSATEDDAHTAASYPAWRASHHFDFPPGVRRLVTSAVWRHDGAHRRVKGCRSLLPCEHSLPRAAHASCFRARFD
jgi:hypothetical protein